MEKQLLLFVSLFVQTWNVFADSNDQELLKQGTYTYDFATNKDSVDVYSSEPLKERPKFDELTLVFLVVSIGLIGTFALLSFVVSNWRGGNPFGISIGKSTGQKVQEFAENFEATAIDKLNELSRFVIEAMEISYNEAINEAIKFRSHTNKIDDRKLVQYHYL